MQYKLRSIVAACVVASAGLTGTAMARPDANHPAVARALAQLQSASVASATGAGHGFQFRDLIVDADGSEHVRFARKYQGLPVIGGDLVVHSSAGGVLRRISQTLKSAPSLDLAPSVQAPQALGAATAAFKGSLGEAGSPQRVVYARGGQPRLAWDVKLIGQKANGLPTREHVIVDAHSGAVLDRWDDIQSADAVGTGISYYSGTVSLHTDQQADGSYAMRDTTRGGHEVYDLKGKVGTTNVMLKGDLVTDADNAWGDGIPSKTGTSDAVDAAYGQSVTWDFYQKLGRNGIADDGRGSYSRIHSGTGPFGIFYNAFWSDDCFCMSYTRMLDASNPALLGLDVVGHEMTHGVTANTAGLIYSGESGGLNEATSDIMGNMVERFAKNPNDPADYLVGEQMFPDSPLRSMVQPSVDGSSADCWYAGVGNIDVHYSSGVANHFFYLLAQGSQSKKGAPSPTCQPGDTRVATGNAVVKGIGPVDATRLYYRALSLYMTSDTGFAGAREATLTAATDLFGASSKQAQAVAAAWAAVNVN
ncbi:MAG TPA: M4 family metallopeptidase [Ideonella sp.]|nr:M4 family metallopeptidase [Ideonella sp.]